MTLLRWRSVLAPAFILLGLAAATLACSVDASGTVAAAATAEPSPEPTAIVESPAGPATIMLALDTSLSMLADDTDPNRFGSALEALGAFLDEAPIESYIGLVSFDRIATVEVAPTRDRAALRSALEGLELDEDTAIGEAIFASLESLEAFASDYQGDAPPARIVVLSDGETTSGRPDAEAVVEAQLAGISVSTVAIGTDAGEFELPDYELPIPVPINAASLAETASGTGGEFFEATTTAALVEIFTDLAQGLGQ